MSRPHRLLSFLVSSTTLLWINGCAFTFDPVEDNETLFCKSSDDCPPVDVKCVANLCVESVCTLVNLSLNHEQLPIDPASGLPIGKGCRR